MNKASDYPSKCRIFEKPRDIFQKNAKKDVLIPKFLREIWYEDDFLVILRPL